VNSTDKNTRKSPLKKLFFEKYLPHLLFVFVGYCAADLGILAYRDLMLPNQPPPAHPVRSDMDSSTARGSYNTVISRNIFSSDGIIPEQLMAAQDKNRSESEAPVQSSLPLTLKGTIVHSNPQKSIANIEVKSKNQVLAYHVGNDIENLATLSAVERGKVIFRNLNNNRLEFIELKTDGAKISFGAAKPLERPSKSDVAQVAPNKFEIKRSDVLKYTSDMAAVLQQAAMAPRRNSSGEIECFKFLSIQPGSIYTQLGFQNGDCIKAVNGEKIDSPAKAMELYNALKNSSSIKMQVERDGRDQESEYNIR